MHIAFIAATAALGGLLFGYDTGVISGALLFLRTAFHLSPLMLGVVTSIALGGAAIGAAFAGHLADRFGRRPILLATSLIFVVGAAVSALTPDLAILLAGRLLVGVGIGGASMLTPLYLAEIAPARERGALVSFNQLAVTLGILGSYLIGYALAADGAWRWMLGPGRGARYRACGRYGPAAGDAALARRARTGGRGPNRVVAVAGDRAPTSKPRWPGCGTTSPRKRGTGRAIGSTTGRPGCR